MGSVLDFALPNQTPVPSECKAKNCPNALLTPYLLLGSGRGCPLLRASNEHSFIVRVLRARRAPGHSLPIPSEAACCASTFCTQWSVQARSLPSFKGWPGLVPNCARRTTTSSSWGFREHGGPTRPPIPPATASIP